MSETVALDFELKSPADRVWHSLTDSATISQWMFFETDDFQAVVGHKFQLRAKPGAGGWNIACEVLAVDKPHRLSYTWEAPGLSGTPHRTTVTWTLTEAENGVTRLHLEQSGFASDAKQEIGGAKYGWTAMIGQLQTVLAA